MMLNDETVKNLVLVLDRLVDVLQTNGMTQAKSIAGEPSKPYVTSTNSSSGNNSSIGITDIAAMAHPALMAAKAAMVVGNQAYSASPLNQSGSPTLTDIYTQKYTRPREELQRISEDLAQSGRALTQSEASSIMKGINQQVMASQQSLKVLRIATSAMPNFERYQQDSFERLAATIENGFKSIDALAGSMVTMSQLPDKINMILGSFFDRMMK